MKDAIKGVSDGEIGLAKLIIMLINIVWGQLTAKKSSKNLDRTHAPRPPLPPAWRNTKRVSFFGEDFFYTNIQTNKTDLCAKHALWVPPHLVAFVRNLVWFSFGSDDMPGFAIILFGPPLPWLKNCWGMITTDDDMPSSFPVIRF